MSSLVVGFAARMLKRAVSFQGETTPNSEVSGGKRPKRSSPDEEAEKSLTVITIDSPERASDVLPALEGVAHDVSRLVHRWRMGFQLGGLPVLIEL